MSTGLSQAMIRLTALLKRGELSDKDMDKAVSMAAKIMDDDGQSARDRLNAANLLAAIQKMAMQVALEQVKYERIDAGKATDATSIKLYENVDTDRV